MLHLNANMPGTSKSVNIKELDSKVVPVHALKAYSWSRSLAPSIGEPRICLGGPNPETRIIWGEGADTEAGIIWWGADPEAVYNLSLFLKTVS
jgi:hypothetical protein